MTVNRDNIDLMIEAIKNEPEPIRMGSFVVRNACGTTACLAGWANILRLDLKGKGYPAELESTDAAAEWMGLDKSYAHTLFYSYQADYLGVEDRKTATIRLLEGIRDGKRPLWSDIIDSAPDPFWGNNKFFLKD